MPTFHHDGIDFRYESVGEGPTVVFCHGLTGDLTQPRNLLGPLPQHSLVVWDARAHGLTEPVGPEDKLNFGVFADDLHALLEHLRLDRVILGGISMGAGVAVRFACQWPGRVEQLVLVRPAWFDRPWPPNLSFARTIAGLIDTAADLSTAKQLFRDTPAYRQLRERHPAAADAAMRYFDQPHAARRNARLWRIPASVPLAPEQRCMGIPCPTLVLGCHDDPAHPHTIAEQWAEALPGATLRTIASAVLDRHAYEQDVRRVIGSYV